MAKRRIARWAYEGLLLSALVVALALPAPGCRRSRERSAAPNTSASVVDLRDVRCVERPEGCVWCEGRGPMPPLVEPDAIPPSLCDPKDPDDCVDFCSRLTPECAVSWRTVPSCLMSNEQEFRRELFRRDTADRPEAVVQGRITDDAGHRVEGAKIRVWFQGTAILDELSGKDGAYHLRLPAGPGTYSARVSHAGLATEITDLRVDRPGNTLHNFRLGPESTIRGRVVGGAGEPIGGVTISAVRSPDDLVDAGQTQSQDDGSYAITGLDVKRYFLRASKFGWLPQMLRWGVTSPATRIMFKLVKTGVIEGRVLDAEGEGQANATVVALASGSLGNGSPIIWTADSDGKFAQDRFELGTYYLWARRGEMLVYPPAKIEISDGNLDARIELRLSHRGARVRGRIVTRGGSALDPDDPRRAVRPVTAGAPPQGGRGDRPRRRLRGRSAPAGPL